MNNATLVYALALISMTSPAFAETDSEKLQDIRNDSTAVKKDHTAIQQDQNNLATNRAQKAQDKAKGNVGAQAVDSVKIGANQAAQSEKKTEKNVDQKVMDHDINN